MNYHMLKGGQKAEKMAYYKDIYEKADVTHGYKNNPKIIYGDYMPYYTGTQHGFNGRKAKSMYSEYADDYEGKMAVCAVILIFDVILYLMFNSSSLVKGLGLDILCGSIAVFLIAGFIVNFRRLKTKKAKQAIADAHE